MSEIARSFVKFDSIFDDFELIQLGLNHLDANLGAK